MELQSAEDLLSIQVHSGVLEFSALPAQFKAP